MFPTRLVEVAGTPFLGQKDPLDNGGVVDFFQCFGFRNPRPIFFERIVDSDYKNALSSPDTLRKTIDYAAEAIETLDLSTLQQWEQDVEKAVRSSYKYDHSPADSVITQRYHETALQQLANLRKTEWTPDQGTNPWLLVFAGGIFQALILNELGRQKGIISSQEAGNTTQRLLPLSAKEDLIVVNLVAPEAIARVKVRAPCFNDANFPSEREEVRRNAQINEIALSIASLYGHHFTRLKVCDMRETTARVLTRGNFAEIYAGESIFAVMSLFPELAGQFTRYNLRLNRLRLKNP